MFQGFKELQCGHDHQWQKYFHLLKANPGTSHQLRKMFDFIDTSQVRQAYKHTSFFIPIQRKHDLQVFKHHHITDSSTSEDDLLED